ncbi:MAG: cytochrome c [Flavipsychrobacter sp.]|nr:cytochrome c [Flavipsychrobacter sp.]
MKNCILLFLLSGMLLVSCGQGRNTKTTTTSDNATTSTPANNGKQLFMDNCARCHGLKQDKLGPALDGVLARWNNDSVKVAAFIQNSQQVITGGQDAYATALYHKWSDAPMPAFTNLKDGEIKAILNYIQAGVE